ncbi:hypothetical protein CDL12_06530 [Handroanthus impetiginosus]|uniref:Uncharacterized protein n=1 Tax=Handroanthus impetiginosus TaxID=429701 RepID=A0A2G9HTA6_9LAMI|nr:hypothetical protein CDL12_06530 [Handroanthus impetiginosus]
MTLLGWMHRKLMHNSPEPMKSSRTGNPSSCFSVQTLSDEQNYYLEPAKTLSHSNIKGKRSSASKAEVLYQEEPFEPFDFLSIGTLGMELLNVDPPTPTLPMSIEKFTDQEVEITENDLNLINYELEKFLEGEEAEIENDTSQRSSQASMITLGYKPNGGADSEGHVHMVVCPLQDYLFASSVELAETDKEVKKERTSLGELFKRNSMVHDDPPVRKYGEEQDVRTKNVAHFMKKVAKKFHSSSTAAAKDDNAASHPIKKKLSKSFRKMFQKKVYPEEMTEKKFAKPSKGKNKGIGNDKLSKSKKNTMKLFWTGICKGASPVNGGHWIKTDSDYLVLEL